MKKLSCRVLLAFLLKNPIKDFNLLKLESTSKLNAVWAIQGEKEEDRKSEKSGGVLSPTEWRSTLLEYNLLKKWQPVCTQILPASLPLLNPITRARGEGLHPIRARLCTAQHVQCAGAADKTSASQFSHGWSLQTTVTSDCIACGW